jgi:hypothetical protein
MENTRGLIVMCTNKIALIFESNRTTPDNFVENGEFNASLKEVWGRPGSAKSIAMRSSKIPQ